MTEPNNVRQPIVAESLAELLDRIRGQRNDYTHLWRCLRFVERSPEIGAIADQQAALDLGRMLTVQLGELRVVECDVAEDLWYLAPDLAPTRPPSPLAALHAAHPWTLREALDSLPEHQGSRQASRLDAARLGTLWLLDEAALRGAGGEVLARPHSSDPGGCLPPLADHPEPEEILRHCLELLDAPARHEVADVLERWSLDAWTRLGVHLDAQRRRWPATSDPLPLSRLLRRLGMLNARFRRIGHVLVAIRQGIQNWLGTLPPGFPTLPPTQRQDREFLFGMQRTLIRDGARRVAELAQELFPRPRDRAPPTPILAFTEDVRSRVNVDGDRIAIFCPLYFQDAPRYLITILHECAHGFIPDVSALYKDGAFARWLEGPVTHAVHRVMTALGGPEQLEEAYDCVAEILADCVGIALGGPGLIRSLLAVTIAETPFSEEVEIAALPDPFTRCRILCLALDRAWRGERTPFRRAALSDISQFLKAYFDEVELVAEGRHSPAHAPPGEEERAEARRLLRFDRAVRDALTDFATTVLVGVATLETGEHWVFRYRTTVHGDVAVVARRLLDRLVADGVANRAAAEEFAAERSHLEAALAAPATPPPSLRLLDEGRFIDANTFHLLWADWFSATSLERCRAPQRDLLRMVQLALCVDQVAAPEAASARRLIESAERPNYFGRGEPLVLTLLDNSSRSVAGTPNARAPDPVLSAPSGPGPWFHALGQFDYALLVQPEQDIAAYPDPFDFGSHTLPYYTRHQELRLLDPARVPGLGEASGIASTPGDMVDPTPRADGPVFHFLHRVLFDRPGEDSGAPPELLTEIVKSFHSHGAVAVRGILRGFTWAEVGLWLECRGDLGAATRAITAVSTRRERQLPAQTHTLTLVRWTPAVAALHERCAAQQPRPVDWIRNLCAGLRPEVGASTPVRFLLTLYWPRGRRVREDGPGPTQIDAVLDELGDVLDLGPGGPALEFADVLGDEDFQVWLDVPPLVLSAPPETTGPVAAAVWTQAVTALLLLYTTRALGTELRLTEVTTQVTLPRRRRRE